MIWIIWSISTNNFSTTGKYHYAGGINDSKLKDLRVKGRNSLKTLTEEVANEGGNVVAMLLHCVGEKDNIVHSITIFLT